MRCLGERFAATQVAVLDRSSPLPDEAFLEGHFELDALVCAEVSEEGEARIWSNFRVHEDGFGRLLVQDVGLKSGGDTSRLLQRVQEIGNYRNMALLGLPLAHEREPELTALENRLANLTREVAEDSGNDDELFQHLSGAFRSPRAFDG